MTKPEGRGHPWTLLAVGIALMCGLLAACDPVNPNQGNENQNGNQQNQNGNNNNQVIPPDADVSQMVRFQGVVWSPAADQSATLERNRFPIPGAAVVAYSAYPDDVPQQRYCNECMEVPGGAPNTIADKVDGSFELLLMPSRTYYLTVQKGEFRRVRELVVPNMPGEVWTFETGADGPRPEQTTLPNRTNLAAGDNIPKIAMVKGAWEDMKPMFESLSFDYTQAGIDFDIFCVEDPFGLQPCEGDDPSALLTNPSRLEQYNLIIVSCGSDFTGGSAAAANLKQWVKDGGKLYVDDFNYDFVEQPWPEFLSWYVDNPGDHGGSVGPCAEGSTPPGSIGICNNWTGYEFAGEAGDPDFAAWLALAEVNRGDPLTLVGAWDYLYELGEGIVGESDECIGNCGPNGEVIRPPKVWMWNVEWFPFSGNEAPATVSWPYYCGKVLYTVYHTHGSGGGSGTSYELLLQEKIMMYLIMEVQTCAVPPIVY